MIIPGTMLTVEEIEDLRRSVRRYGRDGAGDWYLYVVDGPLFGIHVRLRPSATDYIHSWCALGKAGPVVVDYTANPALHLCFFHGLSCRTILTFC